MPRFHSLHNSFGAGVFGVMGRGQRWCHLQSVCGDLIGELSERGSKGLGAS